MSTTTVSNASEPTYAPNVAMIRDEGFRIIRGSIPRQVRAELMAGVVAGHLGHLRRDGLLREVFYAPEFEQQAQERRRSEALAGVQAIARVLVINPNEERDR